MKRKRLWAKVTRHSDGMYFVNYVPYVNIDAALALARNKMHLVNTARVFVHENRRSVMIAAARTSDGWKACCDRMILDKAWPIFESYVRML